MSLCKTCRKALPNIPASGGNEDSIASISERPLEDGSWHKSKYLEDDDWYWQDPFLLHKSWDSLVVSLDHDCPFCWTLWRNIRSSPITFPSNDRITEFKAEITEIIYQRDSDEYSVYVRLMGHGLETKKLLLYLSKTTETCYREAEREFPLAVQHTPASAASVANRWIKTCEANHENCLKQAAPPEDAKMPTRLLDLGDVNSNTWRLYQNPGHVPYAALSHRWSSDTPELHTSNCQNYCNPQPDSALPQNYQDIIGICRAIPIRYLWIDSLCIIQDDKGYEFTREALLMMDIYQYAFLTLSICWEAPGFSIFRRCRPRSIPRPPPPLNYEDGKCISVSGDWMFVSVRAPGEWQLHVGESSINKRAWVLQEKCLSRRLLYLGNDQLYWECDGCAESEVSADYISPGGRRSSILDLTGPAKCLAWDQALQQYTGSDLTFEDDRLVAIAGLAKLIASKTDGTYFAGIWLDTWMQDLLWQPVKRKARSSKLKAQGVTMVAPSWSWLAFSGSVESGLTFCGDGPKISVASPNSFYSFEYQPLALLSQAVLIPLESDPFISFERAILKTRCLLLPTTFAGIPRSDKLSWFFRQDCDVKLPSEGLNRFRLQACDQFGGMHITFSFYFSKPLDTCLQYFLLPLYCRRDRWSQLLHSCVYGLVLQKGLGQDNEEYTRVGSWKEDHRFSSQLSPSISNTIIKLGVGKKSALRDRSLTKNERVFDSDLRKYAKRHVTSEVQFPMPVVKKAMQHQPDSREVEKKAGVSGPEATGQEANEADEDEGPLFRDKRIKCSLLPHFTTAKWGTISLV